MAIVSVTRLRLRSLRYLPEFMWRSVRSLSQARKTHTLPAWQEAEARLRLEGRTNKLHYPSPAHLRGETLPS